MSDQLRSFLDGIGLTEYFDALAAEQVEPEDLPLLSDADLAALGLPLGPRRRLQRAAAAGAEPVPPPVPERRNLTVLFCDMVDSTSVASRIDPEDLRTRFRTFQETCETVIEAEDGFVAHRLGDGLMAHFGVPNALEDAALCAVRAGLEIVERIAELDAPGEPMAVRIGIASGLTVIEEARIGIVEKDEIATGATLALAARLQSLAAPGEVVVSDATRKLLRNAVDLKPLGKKLLKGFPEKQTVWLAAGKQTFPLVSSDSLMPGELLGRDTERTELLDLWQKARSGSGGAVLLVGEPGIGKSRLLGEIRADASQDADVVSLHCYRYRHGAALHPVTDWLESVVGRDDVTTKLAELPGATAQSVPLLSRIMGFGGDDSVSEEDRLGLQDEIIDAVISLLAPPDGRARIALIEDLHWADSTTMDMLDRLAERADNLSVLVCATARPQADRLPRGFHTITLKPLSRVATDALIDAQPDAADLPEAVRRTIAERSGGVPFFAEELTRAVLEAPDTDGAAVPFSLRDTLMARLDRLGAGKPVAQIAALMGPGFSRELLVACSDLPDAQIAAGLSQLMDANLLEERPGEDATLAFRHGLVRDVAYESLLRSRRAVLHRRVAETIQVRFPAMADAQPEWVAHHYTEADDFAAAVPFWEHAAELAIFKASPASAIRYFRRALELLTRQPATPGRDAKEAGLRIRLNMPLTVTTGFASVETEDNLARMAELFEVMEPGEAALQLLWSRSMSALVRADLVSARKTAQRLERLAERAPLPNAERMPARILGYIAMLEGRLDAAEAHFNRVLDGYAPNVFDPILPGHPFDVLGATLSQHAILMALRGRPDDVAADQDRALARIGAFDNPATSFQVLVHLCLARFALADHDNVLPLLADLRDLVDRNEIAPLYVEIWEAWAQARGGALDEGLAGMARALKNEAQYPLWMPGTSLLRVEFLCKSGRFDETLALLDACDADIARFGHTYLLSEVRRQRAICLAALGEPDANIETLLNDAIAIARRQGAYHFEQLAQRDLDQFRTRLS